MVNTDYTTKTKLFFELVNKELKLKKSGKFLHENEEKELLSLTVMLFLVLAYEQKSLFIKCVIDFLNNPTLQAADSFSFQFSALYRSFDEAAENLKRQVIENNEKLIFNKIEKLFASYQKKANQFESQVRALESYCEFYNPELSQDDDFYYDYPQLKQACKKFLDEVKEL